MKGRVSKLLLILGVSAIVITATIALWTAGTGFLVQDRPAIIVEISGTVLYSPAGDSQWITARAGMPLRRGDQLLTLPFSGRAVVQFDDGSVGFSLDPDTLVTLTANWNPLRQMGTGGVHLNHGSMIAVTRQSLPKALTRFVIDTEAAEVTVESTRLMVQVLKDEPTTRVSSLHGEVRVRAKSAAAALYRPDAQRLIEREAVVNNNETMLVYVQPEPTPTSMLTGNLGRVVDVEDGRGRAGVVVYVLGDPALFAITDADGYFAIPGAPAHSELIAVGATDEVDSALELRSDVGQVLGQVIDAASGEVVNQAQIIPMGHPELAVNTGPDGVFVLDELPVGTHSLTVIAPQHISTAAEVTVSTKVPVTLPATLIWPAQELEEVHLPRILKDYFQYP